MDENEIFETLKLVLKQDNIYDVKTILNLIILKHNQTSDTSDNIKTKNITIDEVFQTVINRRHNKGIVQTDICKVIGYNRSMISRMEVHKNVSDIKKLKDYIKGIEGKMVIKIEFDDVHYVIED